MSRQRLAIVTALAMAISAIAVSFALAGSAHFISNAFTITRSGDSLTVTGKEAGLGDEAQINVVLNATAQCINPGDHHPKAANKQSVSAAGLFPVQNGKANFSLTVTATFQPDCAPPMTVVYTGVSVTDTTNGLTKTFSGTF